jgi:hypothetical protein
MNKNKAFNALNKFASSRVALIQAMVDAGYDTAEDARNVVVEWACEKTGCEFTVAGTGNNKLVGSDPKYQATKTVVRDVMLMLEGTTRHASSGKKEEQCPVEKLIAGFEKLTAAQQKKFLKSIV